MYLNGQTKASKSTKIQQQKNLIHIFRPPESSQSDSSNNDSDNNDSESKGSFSSDIGDSDSSDSLLQHILMYPFSLN